MKLLADASLPGLSACFPPPFEVTLYHNTNELIHYLPDQDILLCRSTLKVNATLLENSQLQCLATASSGTDHIDADLLQTGNIQLIDAKGSNAHSVGDYVLASLAYLEKYTAFRGKKAMIIGCGAVGSLVADRLKAVNFEVISYDPLLEDGFKSCESSEISTCDLICVHANLHDSRPHPSRHLLDSHLLAQLQTNTAIINASRGDIVDEAALLKLITPIYYCTDVYTGEPCVNRDIVEFSTLCTPHIAGHSLEAKAGAVTMVSQKLHEYYQLPLPVYPVIEPDPRPVFNKDNAWQDSILTLYNPIDETLALKMAPDKQEAFLRLRKNHQYRHDFKYG